MSAEISILTATYNALAGLVETAKSVESQDFTELEHIVIDGDSTDGTQEWLATRPQIRWISEPDSGIADALNKGLDLATGQWILVLHSEDTLIDEGALTRAERHLNTAADMVSFDVLFTGSAGERTWKSTGLSHRTNFKVPLPHQGLFTSRSLFDRLGRFDERFQIAMDYEFLLRAYRAGATADVVGTVLARMPDTGISSQRDWGSLSERFSEEREAHRIHGRELSRRLMYAAYWPLYLAYRKTRELFQ